MNITVQDQLFAARWAVACAKNDDAQRTLVLDDLTASSRAGGVLPMLVVLGGTNALLCRQLDGEHWLDGMEQAVAYLAHRAELDGPDAPAESV